MSLICACPLPPSIFYLDNLFRITTIDYRSRQHEIDFIFTPYTGADNLTFEAAQETLQLFYINTTLQFDRGGGNTSGLDAGRLSFIHGTCMFTECTAFRSFLCVEAVRPVEDGFPIVVLADPQMPIADDAEPHLTLDIEGIIAHLDGT